MNIYEWMLANITDNGFSAKHIYEGLHMHEFDRQTQEEMCLLYRRWRNKSDRKGIKPKQAYYLVTNGFTPEDIESMIEYSCSGHKSETVI